MSEIESRLAAKGIELPDGTPPVANYIPYLNVQGLVFIAGQIAKINGELKYAGKLGREISLEEGKQAARICGLNLLAQLKEACGGNLDKVKRCVKLTVFVNSTDDFADQPQVANGVSDLMIEVFGEAGKHTRAAVGSNSLPAQTAVEVDGIFEIEQ